MFGTKVDEPATTLFLPSEFMHSLTVTTYDSKPLAKPATTLLSVQKPEAPFSWWNNIWTYLIVMGLIIAFHRKSAVQTSYLALISILGCLFLWAMLYSLHEELRNNYNILLFNPLLLLLAILNERGSRKSASVLAWTCLGFMALFVLIAFSKAHFWIVLPIIIANALVLFRILRQNRK